MVYGSEVETERSDALYNIEKNLEIEFLVGNNNTIETKFLVDIFLDACIFLCDAESL